MEKWGIKPRLFGSQAENCGSKPPYPFIKWEHHVTVAPPWILRSISIQSPWRLRNILSPIDLGQDPRLAMYLAGEEQVECEADPKKLSSSLAERAQGSQPLSPLKGAGFRRCRAPEREPAHSRRRIPRWACPFPPLLFSFSSHEPCYPGCSAEAVKEDGEPSYLRMITIVNIHGWFTYHSWLHRHGSRSEASAGVAWWYILHCATMDLCIL